MRTAFPARSATIKIARISSAERPGPVAQVRWVEHLGDQNHVHLKLATHSLVTLADPAQQLKAGDQVSLEFDDPQPPLLTTAR